MSETPFSPPGANVALAPEEPTTGRFGDRKQLVVLGSVLSAALVAGGAYLMFFSGGSDDGVIEAAPIVKHSAAAPAPSPSAPVLPSTLPVYDGTTGTNPFKALIVPAVATASAAPAPVDPAAVAPAAPAVPAVPGEQPAPAPTIIFLPNPKPPVVTLPVPTPPVATPTAVPTPGPSSEPTVAPPAAATSVKLISVKDDNTEASVYVNGDPKRKYQLRRGDSFAVQYQVLTLTGGKCASFLRGDEKFELCEGQTKAF